jgi:hypothetical protein
MQAGELRGERLLEDRCHRVADPGSGSAVSVDGASRR